MAQQVRKAEPPPAATRARHGAYRAGGQLPAVCAGGLQVQSCSLPVQLPLGGTRRLWQPSLAGRDSSLPGCW